VTSPDSPSAADPVRPSRGRAVLLHLSLVAFAVALLYRAGQVQLVQGKEWARLADGQHLQADTLRAPRGTIEDDRGDPLAVSREVLRLSIAPNQVRPPRATPAEQDSIARALGRELAALGVSRGTIARALDSTRPYAPVPGLYLPSEVRALRAMRGVRAEWVMQRTATGTTGLRGLVGAVSAQGDAVSGLERALDSLLRGRDGERVGVRDRAGRAPWDSPLGRRVDARAGHDVRLTINQRLQEIIERELLDAVERTGSAGGDLVVLDPNDGAILALAGVRRGAVSSSVTPLTEAYEPGSVLKPLFVAYLLDEGRTVADELIDTGNGRLALPGRTITDEHKAPAMSVFDIVRWSSNVGTVRLVTDRMQPDEEYALLRDYGFGTPTALPYPSESRGRLRAPVSATGRAQWTRESPASIAIGYEFTATPVQLALAYAAIANGGELLEPALVREIRSPEGEVVYRHARRAIRRVATPQSTAQVRAMLKAVVDSGTGRAAGLTAFEVGGKSGTARLAVGGRYKAEAYNATFAGMFPMSAPQMVVVARLIEPEGQIFGGLVAGPLVRNVLLGALAARDAALDRTVLERVARDIPRAVDDADDRMTGGASGDDASARRLAVSSDPLEAATDDAGRAAPTEAVPAPGRVRVSLPWTPADTTPERRTLRAVPSVRGLSVREAVRTLHAAGFHVQLQPRGVAGRTRPAAGAEVREGSLIILEQGA
jgi:cell division protein FtsI (penicillin-binding protein 3)